MSGRGLLMWDEAVTKYDFGDGHPMDPVRLALTMGLVRAYGLDRVVDVVAAKPWRLDAAARTPRGLCGGGAGGVGGSAGCGSGVRAGDCRRSCLRGDARGSGADRGAVRGGRGSGVARGGDARGELRGRAASCDAGVGGGVLRVQRRVAGDRAAAGARGGAGRVRGRRCASRGRGAGGVLGRPAGADDLAARASADAVSGDRVAGRDGRVGAG